MTSSGGAGAMAAAGAEGEEWRRLQRAVTGLQRCGPCQARARGFLLRRRLLSVRAEFEAAVLQLEGSLGQLRWAGHALPRPRFGTQPSPGEPLDPGEAAENETIPKNPKNPLEQPDPAGAERAGSCGNKPPSSPLPSGTPPNPQNPPNLGSGAAKSPKKEGRALEWDSSDLGASPEIPADLQGLPHWELQSHRKHLLMELLWVQQAIASRKQFLMLKEKLGIPNHSSSIPEFLDWCGETLELQQQP